MARTDAERGAAGDARFLAACHFLLMDSLSTKTAPSPGTPTAGH